MAIGDGANDISMIQEADVGVGILGKEGNQAASVSDYYFSQFRFLDRLLLHHGRWANYRIAYFFVYYGFKNVFITVILFIYLGYCGWSGTNILATVYLAAYNSVLSVSMTIYYGIWEQDINCDRYPPARSMMPIFYKEFKEMGLLSYSRYFLWCLTSIAAATFVFFTTIYGLSSMSPGDNSGRIPNHTSIASSLSISTLLIITLIIYIDTYNFTIWTWFNLLILGILVNFLYYII
jgi:phospholipid-translocating ATPase